MHLQREYPVFYLWLQVLGKLIVIPFLILIFGTLVIAATFSQGSNFVIIIATFFVQVQLYGAITEFIFACLLFKDRFYCSVRIAFPCKTFQILTIGKLFCERIISENMQEKHNYSALEYRYLFGCIQVDAISADVTTVTESNITINDLEMISSNPMHVDQPRHIEQPR